MRWESLQSRWLLLAIAVASMMLIGLYQYSWTLYVQPIREELGWAGPTIQTAFVVFTWTMTLTQPLAGIIADRMGPRILNSAGGLIAGLGWVASSLVNTPETLYASYGLGGIGVGILYATSIGIANKWFPDRRGLATGLSSCGYGFGAAVFNPMIAHVINTSGFRATLIQFGVIMLAVLVPIGLLTMYPPSGWMPRVQGSGGSTTLKVNEAIHQYNIREMVSTRQWWLIYLAFILMANTGLMVAAQLTSMGEAFNLPRDIVLLATVTFPITNGLGRILGGWVSDRLGREPTMVTYYAIEGALTLSLLVGGFHPLAFIAIVTLIGLVWGPIFTFFPSIIADYYGRRNSTANYGLTYTAKGWGGLLGVYASSWLADTFGGYGTPIILSATFSLAAAVLITPWILRRPMKNENRE